MLATGSMIMVDGAFIDRYPVFAELITYPTLLKALASLGFRDPKFGHGRVISKPPHSPPLFWHEDGRFWSDPLSYTATLVQAFLMFYLVIRSLSELAPRTANAGRYQCRRGQVG